MALKRYVNPFFPNRPVNDPGKFSGREGQVETIIDSLYQIVNTNSVHTIITGDRGIGKSSLLLQTKFLSTGTNVLAERFNLDLGVQKFDFVTAWHDIDFDQSLDNVTFGLLDDLKSNISRMFGRFDFEIDLGGFLKITQKRKEEKSIAQLVDEFVNQVGRTSIAVGKKGKHGVLLFIDELDRMDPSSGIASFIKLSSEKLIRDGITNVAFMCAGITGVVQRMQDEHASIVRTFRDVPIPRFDKSEISMILKNGFDSLGLTYSEEIFNLVFRISAGFPEPVHLIGTEMIKVDDDGYIDIKDYEKAKQNVITDVRRNELRALLERAGYGKYQLILEAMADCESDNVSVDYISNKLNLSQNQFSTNIGTLIEKGIIYRVDRGVYRFVNPLLKEYIKSFGIIRVERDTEIE